MSSKVMGLRAQLDLGEKASSPKGSNGGPASSLKAVRGMSSASGIGKGYDTSSAWTHPIYSSDRITEKKSTFLAHASTLPNPASFPVFLDHLTSLSALKRATHCMYAYRTTDPSTSQVIVGQNDGGESGSGDRLSRLLELSGCENVVVVVSRWYGGVKLGSDRWRLISLVAKQAIEQGGSAFKKDLEAPPTNPKQQKGRPKTKGK